VNRAGAAGLRGRRRRSGSRSAGERRGSGREVSVRRCGAEDELVEG
jgi:hypothetical protein